MGCGGDEARGVNTESVLQYRELHEFFQLDIIRGYAGEYKNMRQYYVGYGISYIR